MPDLPDHQRRIAVTGLVASGAIAGLGARTFGSQESPMSTTVHASGLAETLLASAPHPSLGEHADTFGRLIGSWAGTYRDRDPGGPEETGNMEVHFGRVILSDTPLPSYGPLPGNRHCSPPASLPTTSVPTNWREASPFHHPPGTCTRLEAPARRWFGAFRPS